MRDLTKDTPLVKESRKRRRKKLLIMRLVLYGCAASAALDTGI